MLTRQEDDLADTRDCKIVRKAKEEELVTYSWSFRCTTGERRSSDAQQVKGDLFPAHVISFQ